MSYRQISQLSISHERIQSSARMLRGAVAAFTFTMMMVPFGIAAGPFVERSIPGWIWPLVGLAPAIFLGVFYALYVWAYRRFRGGSRPVSLGIFTVAIGLSLVWTAVVLTAAINAGDPRALPWYVAAYIVSLYIPIVIARGAYEAVLQSRSSEGTSLWAEATRGFGTDAWHAIGMPEASYEGVLPSNRVKLLAVGAFVLEGWVFDAYAGLPNRLLSTGEQAAAGPLPFGAHLFLPLVGLAFFLLGARLLFWLGNRLRLSARRRLTRTAQELMLTDTRPPVLFLRSFADDQLSLQAAKIPWCMRVLDPGSQAETLEELITRNYSPIGPIVAIGRPGDDLPPLGAARQYVGDLEWKAAVADLMDAAALIVVGLGESDGLSWELSELVRRDHLARSIFIMPPGYAADPKTPA